MVDISYYIALQCTIFVLLSETLFFGTSTATVSFKPRHRELLNQLIDLQSTRCADVSICNARSFGPCCHLDCECDKDQICIGKNVCCMQWDNNEFMSLTGMYDDVIAVPAAATVSKHDSLRKTITTTPAFTSENSVTLEPKDVVGAECIDAKAITTRLQPEPVESVTTYLMVTRCPYNFTQTSPDIYSFELKCTLNDSSGSEVAMNTPVTSLDTRVTYRNVFCYYCNEGGFASNYVQWNVILMCPISMMSRSKQYFAADPETEFKKALQDKLSWCNVLYQPPRSITGLVNKCGLGSTSTRCVHNTRSHILKNICQQFYSTLDILDKHFDSINLDNITCFLCTKTGLLTYGKNCWVFTPEDWETYSYLQLNTHPNTDNDTSLVKGTLKIPKGNCGPGMLSFKQTKSCRVVYCPEYFFEQKGVCFPTYLKMENVYFKAGFLVRVKGMIADEHLKEAVKSYWSKTNSLIGNLFSNYSYELHQSTNGDFIEYRSVICFVADVPTTTFLRSYALLQLLVDEIRHCRVRVGKHREILVFNTQLAYKSLHTDRIGITYKHGDLDTSNMKEMRLSKASFCYRVVISEDEITKRNDDSILLRSGRDILLTEVTLNEDSDEMVCINQIESGSTFKWKPKLSDKLLVDYPNSVLTRRDRRDEQAETNFGDLGDLSKEIIITIVVSCIVLSIFVSRGVLSFIQRRQQPSVPKAGTSN